MEKLSCVPENAKRMREWIANRGGVAVWRSVNLSSPGASWSTPAMTEDGNPTTKPSWQCANTPERIITDPSEIDVVVPKEVRRFRVAVRSSGLMFKLTDAASRKLRMAVAKAGEGAWYEFDYGSQEAVVFVPSRTVPLSELEDS